MQASLSRCTVAGGVSALPNRQRAAPCRAMEVASVAGPIQDAAAYFNTLGLPSWLIKWGHPGNMGVVLSAMGGYGSYLGWQIRTGTDAAAVEKAQSSHAGIMVGMSVFFALGAIGGMTSMAMQGKPIFSSTHAWTGLAGLSLLGLNGMLSLFFEEDPQARNAHAYLGSATMVLFVIHAAVGLNHGLNVLPPPP